MRLARNIGLATLILSLVVTLNRPAFALSQEKWTKVCVDFLGIRSATTQVDKNGAGYGMDDGNTVPMNCLMPAPHNWDAMLRETIKMIKAFPNSGDRYLLLVTGCTGLARDYPGTFPKCNRVTGNMLSATPNTMANYTEGELVDWVVANIP